MIIAIDFDDTIATYGYPDIIGARLIKDAKKVINKLYSQGHTILIWSCRSSYKKANVDAMKWLDQQGVLYHQFNREAPQTIFNWRFVPDYMWSPKIYADIYIDDKQVGGLPSWEEIYKIIQDKENK